MAFYGFLWLTGGIMDKHSLIVLGVEQACKKYGAYVVRKTAKRQIEGDTKALAEVGLLSYVDKYSDVLHISTLALSKMTPREILDENGLTDTSEYSDEQLNECMKRILVIF